MSGAALSKPRMERVWSPGEQGHGFEWLLLSAHAVEVPTAQELLQAGCSGKHDLAALTCTAPRASPSCITAEKLFCAERNIYI